MAEALLELGCPKWVLALSLPVHIGPRSVVTLGLSSSFEAFMKSIVAGCPLATLFARGYYRQNFREVVEDLGHLRHWAFLDDFTQLALQRSSEVGEKAFLLDVAV